jgi:hypothetical protein
VITALTCRSPSGTSFYRSALPHRSASRHASMSSTMAMSTARSSNGSNGDFPHCATLGKTAYRTLKVAGNFFARLKNTLLSARIIYRRRLGTGAELRTQSHVDTRVYTSQRPGLSQATNIGVAGFAVGCHTESRSSSPVTMSKLHAFAAKNPPTARRLLATRERKLIDAGYSPNDAAAAVALGIDAYKRALSAATVANVTGLKLKPKSAQRTTDIRAMKFSGAARSQTALDSEVDDFVRHMMETTTSAGAARADSSRYAVGKPAASRTKMSQAAIFRIAKAFRQA